MRVCCAACLALCEVANPATDPCPKCGAVGQLSTQVVELDTADLPGILETVAPK